MAQLPYDDRDGFIWMDGQMLPWREAKVHFLTHALHYGTQVFEGERAYNGKIFKSQDHSQRLLNSAKIIHLEMHHNISQIEEIKQQVLKANNLTNAYVRVAAWRGPEMGIDISNTKTHMAVAAWDWGRYFDPAIRETGISLGTSKWRKPAPNTAPTAAKTASLYNMNCIAKYEAKQAGFHDAFMLDFEGYVAESSGANLFMVKDGTLFTPLADRFLNGITRQSIMEIARELGIPVEERRIKPSEINEFEEFFLTGTAAEVTAIGKIDDQDFKVGPVTRKLRAAYEDLVNSKSL